MTAKEADTETPQGQEGQKDKRELDDYQILELVRGVFERFKRDGFKDGYYEKRDLMIRRISEVYPLYAIFPNDLDGEVEVIPDEKQPRTVVVKAHEGPGAEKYVRAKFGYLLNGVMMVEWLSYGIFNTYFEAPKSSASNGSGILCGGYIAAIKDGQIQTKYGEGIAQYFVIFPGMDGNVKGKVNAYHGCVIIES